MPARHPVIRQVYVSGALLAFAASFVQLWEPKTPDSEYATMNLWSAVAVDNGGAALVGVILVLALAAAAIVGSARTTHGYGVPVTVLAIGALALLLLLLKPGTGSSPPSFGPGASLLCGTALFLMAAALADALLPPSTDAG